MNVSVNIIPDPVKKNCYIICFSFTVLKKRKKELWIRLKLQKNPPSCYICDRQSRLCRLRKKRKRKKRLWGKKERKIKTLNDLPQRKNFLNVHLGEQQLQLISPNSSPKWKHAAIQAIERAPSPTGPNVSSTRGRNHKWINSRARSEIVFAELF